MSTPWLAWSDPQEDAGFQGIAYLELLLLPTPSAPTNAQLIVHLQQTWTSPFTLTVTLTGGVTTTFAAADWAVGSADPVAQTITLTLFKIGDPTAYTVTLLDGPAPPYVNPFFASADFVFSIDCERDDCQPLAETAPKPPQQRPAIDLLTKDYYGFVNLLANWVQVKNPSWADLAPASLERVLVELLAHHGDMLSYYQDRVGNEAFIDTASQRYSLRQHATLLGTSLFDGTAAETTLAFTASADGYVPAGTQVTLPEGVGDAQVFFHLAARTRVLAAQSDVLTPSGAPGMQLAAWPGAVTATVPAGATQMLLWGTQSLFLPGQQLAVVQGTFPNVPFSQLITLTSIQTTSLPGWVESPSSTNDPNAAPVAVTIITFEPALLSAVSPWDPTQPPFHLYGNLGLARFGQAVLGAGGSLGESSFLQEGVFSGDRQNYEVQSRPGFTRSILRAYRLAQSPVVFQAQTTSTGILTSTPIVDVTIAGQTWSRVDYLTNAQSYDTYYVATADEDGSLWLEFGDGTTGMAVELFTDAEVAAGAKPPSIVVDYRVGAPIAGNVGAGILSRFDPTQPSVVGFTDLAVVNVVPGTGGQAPETSNAARLRIPASLRNGQLQRAVTLDDYATVAIGVTVGDQVIARAAAKLVGGPFNAVLVLVETEGQVGLSPALQQAVYDRIDALRMAGREHFVSAPDYVPIELELAICVEPGALPYRVRDAVLAALLPGTSALPGFFNPAQLTFGEELELGQLLAFVQRIAGVRSVKAILFRKLGVPSDGPVDVSIKLGPTQVIRMDGDADHPDNGKLSVYIVGVDPEVTAENFIIEEVP